MSFLRELLDERGSSRGFAVARLMLMGVVFFRTLDPMYVGNQVDPAARVAAIVLILSSCLTFVGYKTRASSTVVLLSFAWLHVYHGMFLGEAQVKRGLQLGQVLIALPLSPCGRSLSVDRWLEVRSARARGEEAPPEEGPLWATWFFAISLATMYFWAGVDKLDAPWFTGQRVDRLFIYAIGSSDWYALHPFSMKWVSVLSSWGVLAFEFILAFGLLIPRVRPYMVLPGIALHIGIWLILGVWPFTITCIANYAVIARPAWVHELFERIFERAPRVDATSAPAPPRLALRAGLGLVFTVACLVGPLRAGQPEGPRWEWRMHNVTPRPACEVRYFREHKGERTQLERWTYLEAQTGYALNPRHRFVTQRSLRKTQLELCQAVLAKEKLPRVDLRAEVRCPVDGEWKVVEDGQRNICQGVRPKQKKRKKKKPAKKGKSK